MATHSSALAWEVPRTEGGWRATVMAAQARMLRREHGCSILISLLFLQIFWRLLPLSVHVL